MTEYRITLREFLRCLGQGREQPDPEDLFRRRQAHALLIEACRKQLTDHQAQIVRLHYSDDLGWVAIAARLQISDAAVIQAHDRAIATLRRFFAARGISSL